MAKDLGNARYPVFVRDPFNYDRNVASDASGLKCEDESLTKQSFAEDADINVIVRRFGLTGQLPQGIVAPTYADFEGVYDFQSAMNVLREAEEAFAAMPAGIRSRFGNDPAQFVSFCDDPANREEAKKLGLVFEKELTAPVEVRIVGDAVKEGASYGGVNGEVESSGRFDVGAVHRSDVERSAASEPKGRAASGGEVRDRGRDKRPQGASR